MSTSQPIMPKHAFLVTGEMFNDVFIVRGREHQGAERILGRLRGFSWARRHQRALWRAGRRSRVGTMPTDGWHAGGPSGNTGSERMEFFKWNIHLISETLIVQ
jgi:hypothetical protein